MANLVFILGAGASVACGAPVMRDFLDRAETLLASGDVRGDEDAFRTVFAGIHSLQAVFAKSHVDSENLEAVFNAFEMAELLGVLGARDLRLSDCMRRLIVCTLEESVRVPIGDNSQPMPPDGYGHFANYVRANREKRNDRISVITFNYDCALDLAMRLENIEFDYSVPCDSAYVPQSIPFLKLHGSVNWAGPGDEHFCGFTVGGEMVYPDPSNPGSGRLRAADSAIAKAKKKYEKDVQPVIVPPTGSKGQHHRRLETVWQKAAGVLAEADSIIVLGYSLPATDEFFRYLFALGTISATRLRRVWVCDKYASAELDQRFRALLGPLGQSRYLLAELPFEKVAQLLANSNDPIENLEAQMRHWEFAGKIWVEMHGPLRGDSSMMGL
jgi:hypothetical protein